LRIVSQSARPEALAQIGGGLLEVHLLDEAAHADAGGFAVREHPAIEIGRDAAVIDHVAAVGVIVADAVRGFR
jgi:hypothetical protein